MDERRLFHLRPGTPGDGPVVYWMQRDQRVADNWALIHAQEMAVSLHKPLIVVFVLVRDFLGAIARQYDFMLRGLSRTEGSLADLHIPLILLQGDPREAIPSFLSRAGAGLLVTDFNPLRMTMDWRIRIADKISIPFHEVDSHNIIPCRFISDKQEYGAYTLRKKVTRLLPEFLTEIPRPKVHPDMPGFNDPGNPENPWPGHSNHLHAREPLSGEIAAAEVLQDFLHTRLHHYSDDRNFPDRDGQSQLSPYLHFGQISAQRIALAVQSADAPASSRMDFLEELIVRRELSDNFCLYNPDYDRFSGFQPWARKTLDAHRDDPRPFLYSTDQLEEAMTHDPLWNAAQREMVITGRMHGYLRMYWAKKILEWTASPEEALEIAIYLNDKYQFDGRDPNGYAGIAWSIGGTHDRPWGERPVFGMIRFMNYEGCRRKFNTAGYISKWLNNK